MKRSWSVRVLILAVAIALVAGVPLLAGCTRNDSTDEDTNASRQATGTVAPAVEPTDAVPPALVDPADPTGDDGSADAPTSTPPETLTVSLYWVSAGENALGVKRTIPYTKAVATATLRELIAGPTSAEKTTWPAISTAIPSGTRLLGVTVADGVAKVDFSREFESGGGTFSMTARLAQVVYTLDQFPTVDAVEFYIEGERVEVFSGEGLILEGPQRMKDFEDALPIDA
jgi:spore germination protein GerM